MRLRNIALVVAWLLCMLTSVRAADQAAIEVNGPTDSAVGT